MFIAQQKKETNIAEYILYMYQIEDILRAYHFDIDKVRVSIIQAQVNSPAFERQAIEWYQNIIDEMKARHLEKKGHLYRLGEIITELIYLHNTLLDVVKDRKYNTLFDATNETVNAFREKSDLKNNHPVEVCLQALYMKLLLKLQKKEISGESDKAFDTMRVLLAYLTKAYHQMKAGDMSIFEKQGD